MKTEMLAAAHWAYVESVLQLHGEDQGLTSSPA